MRACEKRGVEIYRFNSEDYPASVRLDFDPAIPGDAELRNGRKTIAVGRARGIWIRRPQWPTVSDHLSAGDARLVRQESIAAMGGLWRLMADRCVSSPDALTAARWKMPQLGRALKLGFRVPETLVTMDPGRARRFIAAGPTVMKAVQELYVADDPVPRVGTVGLASEGDADSVKVCPTLLQRAIRKLSDIRVTVIGNVPFAVRVLVPPGAPIDFRATNPSDCRFEVMSLEASLAEACVRVVSDIGLRFGAIDLAEDAAGNYWFLECNPNGQWGWLEDFTDVPITDRLVTELLAPTA